MSLTFTKLFTSITESTIWTEPDHTRLVWITMLAMADHAGRVWGSIPGLANRARVPVEKCEEALHCLKSPDKYSRTKDHEGRRIEEIDGGWRLLNHAKYRAIRDEESIKESKRRYINDRRQRERATLSMHGVHTSSTSSTVDRSRANAEADTEAESNNTPRPPEGVKPQKRSRSQPAPKPESVSQQVWDDFLSLRSRKRAPVTVTVMQGAELEASKAGLTLEEFLSVWCRRGSQGLEAAWLKPEERGFGRSAERPPTAHELRVLEAVPGVAAPHLKKYLKPEHTIIDMEPANATPKRLG